MKNLRNVIVACLMVHFLKTTATTAPEISSQNGTETSVKNNTGKETIKDRSGMPYDTMPYKFQPVYLYRGPNRPLEPYFYRPRTFRRHSNVPYDHGGGPRNHRTQSQKGKKQEKVRRDDRLKSSYQVAQTNNRPMRIRYDGKPFESIETMRESQVSQVGNYGTEPSTPYEGKPNYDTLSGGVFDESERNRRRQPTSSEDVVRTGRRADQPSSQNRGRNPKNMNTDGSTYSRPIPTRSSPSRNEGRFRVADHYDGGFAKQQIPEDGRNHHGMEYDYESYELRDSGTYGYRTGPETRQDRNVLSSGSRFQYEPPSRSDTRTGQRPLHTETRPLSQRRPGGQSDSISGSSRHRANYDRLQDSQNGRSREAHTGSRRNQNNRRPMSNKKGQQQQTRLPPPPSRRNPNNYSTSSYSFVAETSSRPAHPPRGSQRGRHSAPSSGRGSPGTTELVSDYDYSQNEQ